MPLSFKSLITVLLKISSPFFSVVLYGVHLKCICQETQEASCSHAPNHLHLNIRYSFHYISSIKAIYQSSSSSSSSLVYILLQTSVTGLLNQICLPLFSRYQHFHHQAVWPVSLAHQHTQSNIFPLNYFLQSASKKNNTFDSLYSFSSIYVYFLAFRVHLTKLHIYKLSNAFFFKGIFPTFLVFIKGFNLLNETVFRKRYSSVQI